MSRARQIAGFFETATERVQRYVRETEQQNSRESTLAIWRSLRYDSASERLGAYLWLLAEKHKEIRRENYERASMLQICQDELAGRISPHANSEYYTALESYLASKGIPAQKLAAVYEEALLQALTINDWNDALLETLQKPIGEVFMIRNCLKRLGSEAAAGFSEYFFARDDDTVLSHKLGIRGYGAVRKSQE